MNAAQAAWLPEIRGQGAEATIQWPEARGQKSEAGERKPEASSQRPEVGAEPSDDAGEDAEVVTKPEANPASETNVAPPPPDDDGYVWPEGTEAVPDEMKQNAAAPEVANAPLPSLDELVKRIPADVRETLDDLFRVKFTSVKRVPPTSLKN